MQTQYSGYVQPAGHFRRYSNHFLGALIAILLQGCTPSPPADSDTAPAVDNPAPQALNSTDEFQAVDSDFGPREEMPGAPLYASHCATCHNGSVAKAPHFSWLEMMTPGTMLATLNEGLMRTQAAHLNTQQRKHIVEYITRASAEDIEPAPLPWCESTSISMQTTPTKVGWGHDTARYTPLNKGGIDAASASHLELKWAFTYPNALRARSQPAVGWDTIYSGSQDGTVYAFDLDSGCVRWTFKAAAEVRTGIVLTEPSAKQPPMAIFGDILAKVWAVNALTGELLWSRKADDHPSATLTGTPALNQDTLYIPVSSLEVIPAADPNYPCCTFRGSVLALKISDGSEVWRHYTIADAPSVTKTTRAGTNILAPSGAPVWSSPAIDRRRNLIYVGTGENYSSPADGNSDAVIAIDITTGSRVWTQQSTSGDAWNVACMMQDNPNCPPENGPDFDHGSSMILVNTPTSKEPNKQILAAGHKNGTVFALDPDNQGEVLWSTKVGRGSIQGGVHFGMSAANGIVYVPINDMNDTRNGDFLDPQLAQPGLHAIDMIERAVIWNNVQTDHCEDEREFCDPGISAPVTASADVVFAGHLDGMLRAYRQTTGEVVWQYDTTQPHTGVNNLVGRGGSMSGAGPTVAAGHLIVNSGYGLYFHEPGNLLLVFAAKTTH